MRKAEPQGTLRVAAKGESLWRTAPGWRISAIAATLLTVASAGVFWLDDGSGERQPQAKSVPAAATSHGGLVLVAPDSSPARHSAPPRAMEEPQPASPVHGKQVSQTPSSQPLKLQSPEALPSKPISKVKPNEQVLADAVPTEVGKATTPQPQTASSPGSCAITLPFRSRHYASGVVSSVISSGEALSSFARDEAVAHGRVDPAYIDLFYVRVATSDGHHPVTVVPKGLKVRVGDRVGMQDGRRSAAVPCGWIPNSIIDDFGPAPTTANPVVPANTASGQ